MAELEPKRSGRGRPPKKKKATQNLSHTRDPSGLAPQKPARLQAALDLDSDLNSDSQEEAESGDPEIWDPHSGMKPSPTDDITGFEEEDEEGIEMELEDISLSERTDSESLRDVLVGMLQELDADSDMEDEEWLPWELQRRKARLRDTSAETLGKH